MIMLTNSLLMNYKFKNLGKPLEVEYSNKSKKVLKKMDPDNRDRITREIENKLVSNPIFPGDKKLINEECWRRRVGAYRIIYKVDSDTSSLKIIHIFLRNDGYHRTGKENYVFAG